MNKSFNHWIFRVIGGLILSYAVVIGLAYLTQERMMFYPTTLEPKYKFELSLQSEEKFTDTGNEVVHSLLVKAPQSKGLVLFFHGNAGNLKEWASVAQEIALRVNWDVWMVDYPGYGKSTGSIHSQEQLLNSVRRVFAQAKAEFPDKKIVFFGRSIGSGIAVKMAAENLVQGLVLETPYLSISRMTQNMYPWIPLFALKYPMPSEQWIEQVQSPILILHGDQDEIIPFEHGSKLSALSTRATFVRIPEGRHNNLSIFDLYWSSIESFFKGLAG